VSRIFKCSQSVLYGTKHSDTRALLSLVRVLWRQTCKQGFMLRKFVVKCSEIISSRAQRKQDWPEGRVALPGCANKDPGL
jgi:hypothetical protein